MKRILLSIVALIIILIVGFTLFNTYIYNEKQGESLPGDFKNVTFSISGDPVTMQNGVAEVQTEFTGASKTTV